MTLARPDHPPTDDVPGRQAPRRVLVAEDNRLNSLLIAEQLRLFGFEPEIVASGRDALAQWRSGGFVAVLTDINMPDMDGYALARAIRSEETESARIPIVALTADAFLGKTNTWKQAGIDVCLTKPIELATLKAELDRWVQGSAAAAPHAASAPIREEDGAVDPDALPRIIGDDPIVLSEFLASFSQAADGIAACMGAAMARSDRKEVGGFAHQLKASAAAVGAGRLSRICASIESAARGVDDGALAAAWAPLVAEVGRVRQWISAHATTEPAAKAGPATR